MKMGVGVDRDWLRINGIWLNVFEGWLGLTDKMDVFRAWLGLF